MKKLLSISYTTSIVTVKQLSSLSTYLLACDFNNESWENVHIKYVGATEPNLLRTYNAATMAQSLKGVLQAVSNYQNE